MNLTIPSLFGRSVRILSICAGLAVLVGCAKPSAPVGVYDPHEAENRDMHAFNLAADTHVLKPVSRLFGKPGGGPAQQGVANFAGNLELPGDVVNHLLQFRIGKATENTLRFAINSTIGLAGVFDPATAMGVAGKKTDFGETLHVWGVGEGYYLELPLLGPSTSRDALGEVVDSAMNPVGFLLPKPESYIGALAKVASKIGDRARYSETVDSVLYDSADGYAQARLLYLQNRRYELGQTSGEDDFEDPYAE
jgi:phospholipid-binding lipoprotein MlaA